MQICKDSSVRHGLKVTVEGTDLFAYVHRDHFPSLDPDNVVPEDEDLVGEVLYVLPTVNAVYLSLKPKCSEPFANYKVGDLVEGCEIIRSVKSGVMVRFPVKSETAGQESYGFVSLRNLSEGKDVVADVKGQYPLGAKKSVRIFQYDHMDGIFICSMQKTMLKQSVMKIDQLSPGDKVTATISRLEKKGAYFTRT